MEPEALARKVRWGYLRAYYMCQEFARAPTIERERECVCVQEADLRAYYMCQEFALCKYGTVLRIMNVKSSVHRTMMGTNVEALLVDVVGACALAYA